VEGAPEAERVARGIADWMDREKKRVGTWDELLPSASSNICIPSPQPLLQGADAWMAQGEQIHEWRENGARRCSPSHLIRTAVYTYTWTEARTIRDGTTEKLSEVPLRRSRTSTRLRRDG